MEEFEKKPKYAPQEEIYKAIGKVLWGKDGKVFSMRRLILAYMKKKFRGRKKK
ncbi:MAG: hypothetical protein ACFFB0_20530 [Promethearchaeota archaeon]